MALNPLRLQIRRGELVMCPYDSSHFVKPERLAGHILKCARSHSTAGKRTCPFNSSHVINCYEFGYHVEHCPDRGLLHNHKYTVGNEEKLDVLKVKNIDVPCEENWDDMDAPTYNPMIKVENDASLLIFKRGAIPSERKEFTGQRKKKFNAQSSPSKSTTSTNDSGSELLVQKPASVKATSSPSDVSLYNEAASSPSDVSLYSEAASSPSNVSLYNKPRTATMSTSYLPSKSGPELPWLRPLGPQSGSQFYKPYDASAGTSTNDPNFEAARIKNFNFIKSYAELASKSNAKEEEAFFRAHGVYSDEPKGNLHKTGVKPGFQLQKSCANNSARRYITQLKIEETHPNYQHLSAALQETNESFGSVPTPTWAMKGEAAVGGRTSTPLTYDAGDGSECGSSPPRTPHDYKALGIGRSRRW